MNVVVSGCSYSAELESYPNILKHLYGLNSINLSIAGQSNYSIIKKIYDYIILNNTQNTLFVCQITYLHRIGWYHNVSNRWIDYQPNLQNILDTYINVRDFNLYGLNEEQFNELNKMYQTYLKYVYDDVEQFNYLMYQIDTITEFVKSKNNEILFIYWPELNTDKLSKLKCRNFFNINNEYSMLNWSIRNKKTKGKIDTHLSEMGHRAFAKELFNYIHPNTNLL